MSTDFDNDDDVLDVRDIIERIEELEDARDAFNDQIQEWEDEGEEFLSEITLESSVEEDAIAEKEYSLIQEKIKDWGTWEDSDEGKELKILTDFLSDFCGYGGDEQWRGDWYPVTLVRDSYWEDFCEEEVKDLGYIAKDFPWWIEIDWKKTSEHMKEDYTSGNYDGVTFWGR